MRLFVSTACLVGLVMMVSACSQTRHANAEADSADAAPALDPGFILTSSNEEIKADDLTIRQVERNNGAAETDPWDKSLTVEQLNSQNGGDPAGYAFDAVKGDHPCGGRRVETDACQAVSKAIAEAANKKKPNTQGAAEAELQTLTTQIIDPDTFDPLTTIDEIGRGGQFSSLAAQAVGAEFLTPAAPEVLIEDATSPDGAVGAGLPPFVLDVTVTQGTPGSPPPAPSRPQRAPQR